MGDRLHSFEPTICGLAFSETTAVSSKSATSLYHGRSQPLRIKFCSRNPFHGVSLANGSPLDEIIAFAGRSPAYCE
jgi:hypothetical protein